MSFNVDAETFLKGNHQADWDPNGVNDTKNLVYALDDTGVKSVETMKHYLVVRYRLILLEIE